MTKLERDVFKLATRFMFGGAIKESGSIGAAVVTDPKDHGCGFKPSGETALADDLPGDPVNSYWSDRVSELFGVIIGHWMVSEEGRTLGATKNDAHVCISRCGIASIYKKWEIENGKLPKTCYACRPGTKDVPGHRVLPESWVDFSKSMFEEYRMPTVYSFPAEERSNMKTREAIKDWEECGRNAINALLDGAKIDRSIGWHVTVASCVDQRAKKSDKSARFRVVGVDPSQRSITLSVQPQFSGLEYTVRLALKRKDVDFSLVHSELQSYAKQQFGVKKAAVEEVAAAATGSPEASVDRMTKLRDSLDRLIAIRGDLTASQSVRSEARAKLEAAHINRQALAESAAASDAEFQNAKTSLRLAREREQRARIELSHSQADLEQAKKRYDTALEQDESIAQQITNADEELKRLSESAKDADAMMLELTEPFGGPDRLAELLKTFG